jgi:DNA-binding CsgD family transcriptional regulator
MPNVFLATLGQRPEAITIAYDVLAERIPFDHLGILHTDPHHSGIAPAFRALKQVLERDYPHTPVQWHETRRLNGESIIDLDTQAAAHDYYLALFGVLRAYRANGFTLHLHIAGGRKAMSVYAALAAALVFGGQDRVWTLVSPADLVEQRGLFHLRPGMRDRVHMVEMPVLPARLHPAHLPTDPTAYIEQRRDPRADFLARLTPEELRLTEHIAQQPYASSKELAAALKKSPRTVNNQLRGIYDKMTGFFEAETQRAGKKQVLVDLLLNRL